jgi:quercetin dioxygenase-like cupin family protein
MKRIEPIDVRRHSLDIYKDWSISARERKPGPPERVDGMTVGIVSMTKNAPHGGEVHPDGDEILYVISGQVRVSCDSMDEDLILSPGQACIVPRGEWHQVHMLAPTELLHITPGPHGDHRPRRV